MINLLKRYKHKLLVISCDIMMVPIAWILAYALRFNLSVIPINPFTTALETLPTIICIQTACYLFYKQHRGIWHFASVHDLIRIIKSVVSGTLLSFAATFPYQHIAPIPRSIFPLYTLILICQLGGMRLFYRWIKENKYTIPASTKIQRILIIGAGHAGELLARELKRDQQSTYQAVAFLDDKLSRQRTEIQGIPVVGQCTHAKKIIEKLQIDLVTIAIPSATTEQMRDIVSKLTELGVKFQTLPNLSALASGKVRIEDLRDVSLEDLLGRDPVILDHSAIHETLHNKRILITGGGGSIGSELCRQVIDFQPESLLILDHSEYNLYLIERELREKFPTLLLHVRLINITDDTALKHVFSSYKPHIVFHAAAYKHVPMLESQARCAIKNNLLGTRLVADTAADSGVEQFILVSTDKAVNPTNVMGATKRAAEIYCQNLNNRVSTQFITVRFGNVLGSAGSVVPLFKKQLKSGGPITITHPEITRYFMLIPEACQLILQSATLGNGGEIFVLDMGESIKITFLAKQLIRLSGKELGEDIKIKYTGLRPGEKLYEELFHEKEMLQKTTHEKIFTATHRTVDWEALNNHISDISLYSSSYNQEKLLYLLKEIVTDFNTQDALVS